MPEFTLERGVATMILSAFIWFIIFLIIHYLLVVPFMKCFRKVFPSTEYFHKMSTAEQLNYTGYYHGIAHAGFSSMGAIYGFIYADGQMNTTWFHCNFYKLNMFDC